MRFISRLFEQDVLGVPWLEKFANEKGWQVCQRTKSGFTIAFGTPYGNREIYVVALEKTITFVTFRVLTPSESVSSSELLSRNCKSGRAAWGARSTPDGDFELLLDHTTLGSGMTADEFHVIVGVMAKEVNEVESLIKKTSLEIKQSRPVVVVQQVKGCLS